MLSLRRDERHGTHEFEELDECGVVEDAQQGDEVETGHCALHELQDDHEVEQGDCALVVHVE